MNNRHFQFRNNFPSEDLSMTLTFVNSSVSFSLRSFKAALDFSHLNEVRNKINRRVFLIEWAVRWKCGERRRLLKEDINRENRKISSTIKFKIYRLPSSNVSCMPIPSPHSQFYRHGAIVPALLKYNLNTPNNKQTKKANENKNHEPSRNDKPENYFFLLLLLSLLLLLLLGLCSGTK